MVHMEQEVFGDDASDEGESREGQVWVVRHTRAVKTGARKKSRKASQYAMYSIDDLDEADQAAADQDRLEDDEREDPTEADVDIDDPELYVRHQLRRLAMWDEPAFSSLGLSMVLLVFGLVHYSEYSLLTLLSFMVLFQLTLSAITVSFTPVLRDAKIVGRHFTAERFVEQRRLVPASEIDRLSKGLGMIAGTMVENLEHLLFSTNDMWAVGVLVGVICAVMILNINYEAYMLLTAVCVAFFTLPPLYNANREYIDDVLFASLPASGLGRGASLSTTSSLSDDSRD